MQSRARTHSLAGIYAVIATLKSMSVAAAESAARSTTLRTRTSLSCASVGSDVASVGALGLVGRRLLDRHLRVAQFSLDTLSSLMCRFRCGQLACTVSLSAGHLAGALLEQSTRIRELCTR